MSNCKRVNYCFYIDLHITVYIQKGEVDFNRFSPKNVFNRRRVEIDLSHEHVVTGIVPKIRSAVKMLRKLIGKWNDFVE